MRKSFTTCLIWLLSIHLGAAQSVNGRSSQSYALLSSKGPNPYIDVTAYGGRAVAADISTTATINSGSSFANLASASGFQNGDGVVIYGAGSTNRLSTPGAPTVTPSVASGPTGTGTVVNAPSGGAINYRYEIVARDKDGGLTAASSAGMTSMGSSSLGQQSVSVTALSRSNNTVTAKTASAHGLSTGSLVYMVGDSDASFDGFYIVTSVPSRTSFTYLQGMDTRAGATTRAAGGGTAYWYNCNHVTWTAVRGAWQYYIYGNTSGSLKLLGATRPGDDAYFDDFGPTMLSGITLPDFVPLTPPARATNDYLSTTISFGAGTTTLALANAAGNSVRGAIIKFDDAPAIFAAATAAQAYNYGSPHVHIPASSTRYWYVNSHLAMPRGSLYLQLDGELTLNETIEIRSGQEIHGTASTESGQFDYTAQQTSLIVSAAYPGILITSAPTTLSHLNISTSKQGIAVVTQNGGTFNNAIENCYFYIPAGDYMGMADAIYNSTGQSFNYVNITAAQGNYGTLTPVIADFPAGSYPAGVIYADHLYLSGRGIGIGYRGSFQISHIYGQALSTPFVMGFGTLVSGIIIDQTNDSGIEAEVANWGSMASVYLQSGGNQSSDGSGGRMGATTGNPIYGLTQIGIVNSGQNFSSYSVPPSASISIPIYSPASTWSSSYGTQAELQSFQTPVHFPSQHTIFWDLRAPTGVSVSLGSGGSKSTTTTYYYSVSSIGIDGAISAPSTPTVACTPTSGKQTCDLSWNAVKGAAAYAVWWNTGGGSVGVAACFNTTVTTCNDGTPANTGWGPPSQTGTGLTTIMNTQVITPQLTISGSTPGKTVSVGVPITAGAGAPSGPCQSGALYLRTDGGRGTGFYSCESSAWVAK